MRDVYASAALGLPPYDKTDHTRSLIISYASQAAEYADMLARCAAMNDDDLAHLMKNRLDDQVRAIDGYFKLLAADLKDQPANDAAAYFDRQQVSPVG